MKAVRYWGKWDVRCEEVPIPTIGENESLVKVAYTGICGSDTFIYSGTHPRATAPLILGHEFSGTICELPKDYQGDLSVGDVVAVNPLLSCFKCTPCLTGNSHVCSTLGLTGIDEDGSFAEYVKVRIGQIVKLPPGMSAELGAIVEPVAVAVHAVRRSALKIGDFVAVVGGGPIGFVIAAAAQAAGARKTIVIEPNAFRRSVIASFGIEAVDVAEGQLVMALTGGDGADVVFEAAGVPASIEAAVKLCKIRGRVVLVGVFKQPVPVDLQRASFAEIELVGTRVYSQEAFRGAVELVAQYPDISRFVTHRLPLARAKEGMDLMKSAGENLKILLCP